MRKKVLIVDDDVALSGAVKSVIETQAFCDVRVVNDPREAKGAALGFNPDLIILDVIMPFMDGGTVASQIREEPGMASTPVIFLTSIIGKDEAAMRGNTLGKDPVMAKPVAMDELVARVQEALGV